MSMHACSGLPPPSSTKRRGLLFAAAIAVILEAQCWAGLAAWAFDIEPRDYIPAPSGTNLIALYSVFEDYGPVSIAGGPTIGGNTSLRATINVTGAEPCSLALVMRLPFLS